MRTDSNIISLVPEVLLSRANKMLFLTHIAIGDFTYLQPFFKAFSEKYPHIKIDLWIERAQRVRWFRFRRLFSNLVLLDWLNHCDIFNKIYARTGWRGFGKLLRQARQENYPIVISLCSIKQRLYARYAKKISPYGFVKGVPTTLCVQNQAHIFQIYASWFRQLFDLSIDIREPVIVIPREWMSYAKLKFMKWGIETKNRRFERVLFINSFARNIARCWPIDNVVKLITSLQQKEGFEDAYFIINVEPQSYEKVQSFLSKYCLQRVLLFTVHKNFFQLPAIISLCDFVISVETSIVHLASVLKVPTVALMRKKNPEWRPLYSEQSRIVFSKSRSDWIKNISCDVVVNAVIEFIGL